MTTIILQVVTLAVLAVAFLVWQRNRFFIDAARIADLMAAQLLADYEGELFVLDSGGLNSYARHKYMQMVTEWGLPSAAVDRICELVDGRIQAAQGRKTEPATAATVAIYE